MSIEQTVLEKLRTLPTNKQQKVLDFVELMQKEAEREEISSSEKTEVSFLDAAREFIGCVEGPGDLSTNPKYMEGYGK
ncbi:hypothetical protein BST81_18510 [Leptolyngbya sp. 'hensonii']|uniref:hypothetical protein n=1 Tax=Leptolyngbya sp. 'hensonii' TaxID=1922337 RepID=UPI00094F7A92|nr:hypothetical protein [Leptolyngbya sp. 'hensonii']OLP16975.1 hypothetical protein BST81_18510 [Leptolyngbya sp. 'hensonii']